MKNKAPPSLFKGHKHSLGSAWDPFTGSPLPRSPSREGMVAPATETTVSWQLSEMSSATESCLTLGHTPSRVTHIQWVLDAGIERSSCCGLAPMGSAEGVVRATSQLGFSLSNSISFPSFLQGFVPRAFPKSRSILHNELCLRQLPPRESNPIPWDLIEKGLFLRGEHRSTVALWSPLLAVLNPWVFNDPQVLEGLNPVFFFFKEWKNRK